MSELLAPAGDIEKLKYALIYGADAVFIGGLEFSLRARASNFTIPLIQEACEFAHSLGKKIYVTANILPHNEDLEGLKTYLEELERVGVDAIICASFSIIQAARKFTNLEIHLSTQQSVINSRTILFWKEMGVKRIVLGRELSVKEIKNLNRHGLDIEVFIHGGMCMSYSGRCSLSNTFTGRDANRGGCAHSCRWEYFLYSGDTKLKEEPVSFSAMDLNAVPHIKSLVLAEVSSLKIEGRMKSLHYIATVVKTYRQMLDEIYETKKINSVKKYSQKLKAAENRLSATGHLDNLPAETKVLFDQNTTKPNQAFCGLYLNQEVKKGVYLFQQRNYFSVGDKIELMAPLGKERTFKVLKLWDENFVEIQTANHAMSKVYVKLNAKVEPYSMIRKKWVKNLIS